MNDPLALVRDTTAKVAERAATVRIDLTPETAARISPLLFKPQHWLSALPFDLSVLPVKERLPLIFMFHLLGFSFWGEPLWTVSYRSKNYSRSSALMASLFRAREEGFPVHDFLFWGEIAADDFARVVRPHEHLPLFHERLTIAREAGAVMSRFSGGVVGLLEAAGFDAPRLVGMLADNFQSLRDISDYGGETIYFLKRAQLIAADIGFLLQESRGGLSDLERLSVCADYRLPQILRHFGVLRYSTELAAKIDAEVEIPQGSPSEVEIRACTVTAVEGLHRLLQPPGLTVHDLSDMIWIASQTAQGLAPFHRSRSIYY